MIEITRMGETTHDENFCVLREKGHPVYLLLLVKTPALFETEDGFSQISVSDYAVTADGDNAVIVLTDGFTQRLGLGEHTFRLTTSHPIAAYDDLQTTFTVTFV